jgi:SHAQKYF class myb-like DNA-binding protein
MDTSVPDLNQDSSKEGRWTRAEHELFVVALQEHGRNWRKIQLTVGSRTIQQVRSHGQKYFAKLERRSRSRTPLVLMPTFDEANFQAQDNLMRNYFETIANVNIAFYTGMKTLIACNKPDFMCEMPQQCGVWTDKDPPVATSPDDLYKPSQS